MSLIVRIKKDFGSFKLDVNFENKGGIRSLLGASGSGKSVTLKCIAGIITPDEGYIELNGQVLFDSKNKINLSSQKRHIGYMFQNYALFPNMNVEQNIMTGLTANKAMNKEEKKEIVRKAIEKFELTGYEKHHINEISGGQQQRVALARIIVSSPEIILLDEPFSALDEHLRTKLQMDMKEFLIEFGKDVVIVTHNRDEAYLLSENMTVLSKGQSLVSKPTKELFKDPEYLVSSILTGCKNNVPCETKDKSIYIPSWGIELKTKNNIDKNIKYIGVRAHSFSPTEKENSYEVKDVEVLEQTFDYVVRFRFVNQDPNSPKIFYLVSKDNKIDLTKIKKIGFKTESVLFLK